MGLTKRCCGFIFNLVRRVLNYTSEESMARQCTWIEYTRPLDTSRLILLKVIEDDQGIQHTFYYDPKFEYQYHEKSGRGFYEMCRADVSEGRR